MKSIFKVSLAALSLAFAVSSHAADKLVVATDTAFVPFEFKQGDKYVGFDIDLWAAVAKELKLDYTLKPMDFGGIIPALQTKNVDLALAEIQRPHPDRHLRQPAENRRRAGRRADRDAGSGRSEPAETGRAHRAVLRRRR